ncbi:MAG: 4Fe-4S dicluster domain-containing protein [Eggerthella lenta]|jgi:anaerobic dimethyl sulfoxide reductase subunit B (iron-sulfur subunit)|nr:4Fe-4S dicluster domain-containing protein [Eggerthella lenta]
MSQWGFYINSSSCTGCKACELACKDRNNLDVGARLRRVRMLCGGTWEHDEQLNCYAPRGVFSYAVSFSCGHCDNPSCFAKCPQGAISKDEETGIVVINEEACIGCGTCNLACPYGACQLIESEKKSKKCDLCKDLLDAGEDPACVAICPQRALFAGDIEELRRMHGDARDVQPLPPSAETSPNIVITPHKDAVFEKGEGRPLSLEA